MNNGRMWCVVSPTIGLPIFLGAVALTSMTVHHALLNNTTWFKDFLNGGAPKVALESTVSPLASAAQVGEPAYTVNVAPAAANGASFVVTVTPKPVTASVAKTLDGVALAAATTK
jgi:light-harvesting protein B-800-850 alpha chain